MSGLCSSARHLSLQTPQTGTLQLQMIDSIDNLLHDGSMLEQGQVFHVFIDEFSCRFLCKISTLSEAKSWIMADAIVRRFFSIIQGSACLAIIVPKLRTEGRPWHQALRVAVIRAGLVVAPILLPGPSGHIVRN